MTGSRRWVTGSEEETRAVGEALARATDLRGVLLVAADLGVGKTVLAQGVARALGIRPDSVQSPSYTIVAEHRGPGGRFVHVDLYRLAAEDLPAIGLEELLETPGIVLVEWPERLPWTVPGAVRVELRRLPDDRREIVAS